MSSIDQRIVQMQFDNAKFEQGAKTSMSTLEKLKSALNFDKSVQSLTKLQNAGNRVNFSGLETGVESIASRFTNLGIVGVTALQNITNAAISTGTQMVKSLTLDPILSGFNEYETKMNSITTILTNTKSKGTTLDDVNNALNELNTYADQTIYNFAEMTRNIGTFTAAGVDLDTSVKAIKGIANLAAGSGSTAVQASTAMYQLSQALAAGRVSLQDWNSVVNAGMGGELFQNALKETAKQMGIVVDESVSFRESLSTVGGKESWLTSDVLVKTLEKFADDETLVQAATQVKTITQLFDTMGESVQSGWAQSWEYIIGNREQAAEALTAVSNAFNNLIQPSTDARNAMLQFWNANGGRDAVIQAISNAFNGLLSVISPVHDAFQEVFPPMTGEKLVSISEKIKDLTENFKIGDETAKNLNRTFKGVFSLFDIGANAVTAIGKGFLKLVGYMLPLGDGILSVTANIGDFITGIDKLVEKYDVFDSSVNAVLAVIEFFIDAVKSGIGVVKDFADTVSDHVSIPWLEDPIDSIEKLIKKFIELKSNATDTFESLRESAGYASDYASMVFDKITNFTVKAIDSVKNAIKEIKSVTGPIGKNIQDAFGDVTIPDAIGTGLLAGIAIMIKRIIDSFEDMVGDAGKLTDKISDTLDSVRASLEAYQNQLNAGTLLRIAGAVALLAGSLLILTRVDPNRLASGLGGVTTLLAEVLAIMVVLSKFNVAGITGASTSMVIISIAVNMLASSLLKLQAFQNWDSTWPALVSMVGLMAGLTASAKLLSKNVNGVELIKASAGLLIFSAAVGQLAKSMQTFSELNTEQIIKSLSAIGILLAEIGAFIQFSKIDKLSSGKKAIVEIAAAMLVLYFAVEKLGGLDFGVLVQGMASVSILMLELSVAMAAMHKVNMKGVSTSVIGIATALNLLIIPIEILGRMKLDSLSKGLVSVITAIAAMTLSLNALSGSSGGIVAVSASMVIMASAMALLIPSITILGSLPLKVLAVGLGALAIAFVGLGAAGVALAPLGPALLTVAGAFTLFGVAAASIGAGLVLISAGLATLAVSGVAGATALAGALTILVNTIVGLVPQIAAGVVVAISTFATTLASQAEIITQAISTLLITVAKSIQKTAPALAESFFVLIDSTLAILEEYGPELADKLFNILIGFLEVFEKRMPELVEVGSRILGDFLDGLFKAIDNYEPENLMAMIGAITAISACFVLLSKMSGTIKNAIKTTLAMSVVMGVLTTIFVILGQFDAAESVQNAEALSMLLTSLSASMFIISKVPVQGALTGIAGLGVVIAGLTVILTALGGLSQIPGLTWLVDEGTSLLSQLGTAIGSFVGSIVGGFGAGVTNSFPQIGENLSQFMENATPFFEGISSIDSSALTGVGTLASAILVLTAANVLDGLTSWLTGGNALVKFGQELAEFAPYFSSYYESIKGIDGSVVEASANAALALAEFANKIPNSGGLASVFAGENNLVSFAEQLYEFGPKLKGYAASISGLDANVVINSANAAKALAEFAANIPNTGGLVSIFTGDNSLSVFAEQLSVFGPKLKSYANSISGLDANVVTNSANAAKALSELAANLPNTGGLVSFFTGDNGLGSFGDQLSSFGKSMYAYYISVSGIDFALVATSTSAFKKLADLASNIAKEDYSGLQNFSANLASIGSSGVNSFINAFKDATPQAESAGTSLSKAIVNAIKNTIDGSVGSISASGKNVGISLTNTIVSTINSSSGSVRNTAVNMIKNMINGITSQINNSTAAVSSSARNMTTQMCNTIINVINSNTPKAKSAMQRFATEIVNGAQQVFTSSYSRFMEFGSQMIQNVEYGARSGGPGVRSAFVDSMSSAVNAVSAYYGEFYSAGSWTMSGLADGIWANRSSAINAAASAAASAYAAAKRALDINSPSKKFEWLAKMSDEGLGGGFVKYAGIIRDGATKAADVAYTGMKSALDNLSYLLNGEIDSSPVISPVMDLSRVGQGVNMLNSMLSNQNGYMISYTSGIGKSLQMIGGTQPQPFGTFETNNREVVEAVNNLGQRMDDIAERIENMQIVLDTGATVGGISTKLDEDFGRKEEYKRRNI